MARHVEQAGSGDDASGPGSSPHRQRRDIRANDIPGLTPPAILLGVGLGGFVDGIVLHQLLQWHHLVSNVYPPTTLENTRINITFDGFFHAFSWMAVVAGVALLWRATRGGRPWTWRSLSGWIIVGWGLFNLVEGVVNHHVLQIHRVRPDAENPLVWDLGFLVVGALLVLAGALLLRSDRRTGPNQRETRSR